MSTKISDEVLREERTRPPMHPGRLLELEFLEPLGMTAYGLAKNLGVPAPRVYDVVRGKRGISPDTALRLSRFFGMNETFWVNAQARYDLEIAKEAGGERIEREVRPLAGHVPE